MSNIKFNLKEVRTSKKITQVELEEKTGISQQMISRYESGEHYPQIDTAKVIADALGVTLDELVILKANHDRVGERLKVLENKTK